MRSEQSRATPRRRLRARECADQGLGVGLGQPPGVLAATEPRKHFFNSPCARSCLRIAAPACPTCPTSPNAGAPEFPA